MKKVVAISVFLFFTFAGNAQNVGIGTTTPAASAQLDVSSTTKGFLPPRMDSIQRNEIASPDTGLTIYNTTLKSVQVWNGINWVSTVHFIGERYGGGIVFYVYDNGQHGLIAATANQSTAVALASSSQYTNFQRADGINAGRSNTLRLIAINDTYSNNSYAPQLCTNYQSNYFGDWYLPSKYELNLLYLQKTIVGNFTSSLYWSSTTGLGDGACWLQNFSNGSQSYQHPFNLHAVRCIRAF